MIVVILAFVSSMFCALIGIPVLAKLALRVGLVDHPDDKRKLHSDSIPMVGGIAVFLTMVVIVPIAIYVGIHYQTFFMSLGNTLLGWMPIDFERRSIRLHPDDYYELPGLLLGSAILIVVGILDDRFGIRGREKLFGQIVAATVLIIFGYHFEKITIANIPIYFDVFSVLFVYAWVIAAINSVNLLDGADGVAGTIGIVICLALSIMAIYQGMMVTAIIAVTMAGALLGFLRFNFPPAKAYLGDTGSMLIGFVLSALAIRCTLKQHTAYAFFAPIALLAIPFIDTGAAIIRRRLTGRSIFAVDRGHLHHALMKRGYSPKVSILWVALFCLTTAAGGVMSLLYEDSAYALVSIVFVVIVMIVSNIFGVAEYQLISRKATLMAQSMLPRKNSDTSEVQQSAVHVQGSRDWQQAWQLLCDFAESHRLVEITMDLNAPWMHESFHATQRRSDVPRGGNHEWYSQIPLIIDGRVLGRIEMLVSAQGNDTHHALMIGLLAVAEEIESSVAEPGREPVYQVVDPGDTIGDSPTVIEQPSGSDLTSGSTGPSASRT